MSGSWSCACLLSVPVLGAGWGSRVRSLPPWLAAAPVFLVPVSVLAFVRKGDVPRTDPVVSLPVYFDVIGRYCGDLLLPPISQNLAMGLLALSRAGSPCRLCVFLFSSRRSLYFAFVLTFLVAGCVSPCTFYVIPTILTVMSRTWVANLAIFQQR